MSSYYGNNKDYKKPYKKWIGKGKSTFNCEPLTMNQGVTLHP